MCPTQKQKTRMDREEQSIFDEELYELNRNISRLRSDFYNTSRINTELYFRLHQIHIHERIHNKYKDYKMELMNILKRKSRELEMKESRAHARADVDLSCILIKLKNDPNQQKNEMK